MQQVQQEMLDKFSEKYSLYGKTLFRICMVQLGNKQDAEDVIQEAFLKLMYKAPKFNNSEHEKAWVIRVTINLCKDIHRSIWRKRVVKMEDIEIYYGDSKDLSIVEEILKLKTKYKEVIYLHYYEDYSIKDISEILKLSESAVKMRLKRGRESLKIGLEEEGYEERWS